MSDPFVGEVQIFAFPFAPRNWAYANGSLMAIRQAGSLFALIGNQFGGDGQTTFALPNLVSRAACGAGQSAGNSNRRIGQTFGSTGVALTIDQLPAHNHVADDYFPDQASQLLAVPAASTALGWFINDSHKPFATPDGSATMDPNAIGQAGAGAPHENRQPFLGLNYSIALLGEYPDFP